MKGNNLKKILSVSITGIFFISLLTINSYSQQPAHKYVSIELANTLMEKYPDPCDYPYRNWCYPQGYVLMGFDKLWRSTGDQKYYDYIMKYAESQVTEKGDIPRFKGNSMDDMMAGAVIVWAYKQTGKEKFILAADKIRQAYNNYPRTKDKMFWHGRTTVGEVWVDGCFMGQMFLAKYGKYVADADYCFNEAVQQLIGMHNHLKKGDTGLLLHAWDEDKDASWADKNTGLSSEVWGEGLGWYALVIVETLEILPENHAKRTELISNLQELMKGLKNYQDQATGLWYNIVDKGNLSDNWHDASGSAMFTYAIKRSAELGFIPVKEYEPVVEKAYKGLRTKVRYTPAFGLVEIIDACDGVCVQDNYNIYTNYEKKVNAKEAVAGMLWALTLMEKPKTDDLKK